MCTTKKDPGPQMGNSKWKVITHTQSLPREQGVQALHGAPKFRSPAMGRWTPGSWALKTSEAYSQESWWAIGNSNSSIKGHRWKLTAMSSSTEVVIWKTPGSYPLSDLWKPLRRTGGLKVSWGLRCWWQPFLDPLVPPWHCAGNQHLGFPSKAY